MKLLIVLLIGSAYATTEVSRDRQSALATLNEAMSSLKEAKEDIMHHVTEAKSRASMILTSFYDSVFEQHMRYVQVVLLQEVELLKYGEQYDSWCWEPNIPLLQGIMSWFGTDFSECVTQLDRRTAAVIGNMTELFREEDQNISQNSLLKVFQRKNIITNPQSIVDGLTAIVGNVTAVSGAEFNTEVEHFEVGLKESLPGYSECLEDRLKKRTQLIQVIKEQTEQCTEEQKQLEF